MRVGEGGSTYHVERCSIAGISLGSFDVNFLAVKGPFVEISHGSRGDWVRTGNRKFSMKRVGPWQCHPSSTNPSKCCKILPKKGTGRRKRIETLHKLQKWDTAVWGRDADLAYRIYNLQ